MNPPAPTSLIRKIGSLVLFLFRGLLWLILTLWSTGAVYYSNLPFAWLRTLAAAVFAAGSLFLFARVRPWRKARNIFLAAFGVVVVWFLLIPASNDRDWRPDVALLPYADINGNLITIHNIRNCDYRSETDYTVRHYDRTYDLTKLRSADLYVVHWGSPAIAHTMLSFGFADGGYVCFSIETRNEKNEGYSTIKGLFRQFELTYVVADERDVIRLRTNYRGELVSLYRLKSSPVIEREVFLDYFKTINQLRTQPQWYNVLADNCTTQVHAHTYPFAKKVRWDWRILLNGYVDELMYNVGAIDRSLPFNELRARSLINDKAKAAGDSPNFSELIRVGLPGMDGAVPAK
jgi:hypothetical protein